METLDRGEEKSGKSHYLFTLDRKSLRFSGLSSHVYEKRLGESTDEWIKKLWYLYTTEYYSAIKRDTFESAPVRWMNPEPVRVK